HRGHVPRAGALGGRGRALARRRGEAPRPPRGRGRPPPGGPAAPRRPGCHRRDPDATDQRVDLAAHAARRGPREDHAAPAARGGGGRGADERALRVCQAGRRGPVAALLQARGEEPGPRAVQGTGPARRQPLELPRSAAGRRRRVAAALVSGQGGAVPDPALRDADPASQRATGPAPGTGPWRAPDGAPRPRGRGGAAEAARARSNPMTGGTGGMKTDEPKNSLGALRKEGHDAAEERMEDWFLEGTSSEFEEGEVVRGRVVQVTSTEVLVDVGYKSE